VRGFAPAHFVTLAFNRATKPEDARAKLEAFQAQVDHALPGRNWQGTPEGRAQYVATAEHVATNLYLDAALRVPEKRGAAFGFWAELAWSCLVPGA